MKKLSFDSVLLFSLVIPFIMTYRLSPGDTPYWFFGIIFLGLLLYVVLDLLSLAKSTYFILKHSLLWFLIIVVLGSAFVSAMIVRHKTAPTYMIHDIVIQQEQAIRFLLDGQNPYAVSYADTPLAQWHYSDTEKNPALYHFVMEPFYLIFALPFYVVSNTVFNFFDGRMPLLFLFFILLITADLLVKDKEKKFLFLILLAFNPATLPYTLEGRSDIFMFAFLFVGLFMLEKRKYTLSGIPMALAFSVKQSVWPILPFYIAFLYLHRKNSLTTIKALVPFFLTAGIIIAPFLLWDPKAFVDSTVFYLSGNTANSYPISGYGLGKVLQQAGFIKDVNQYYPFHIWQLFIGLPLVILLMQFLKKSPTVHRLIIVYGIFLFVFWYLSRYFNNSHLSYLSMVFITAYFWPESFHEK